MPAKPSDVRYVPAAEKPEQDQWARKFTLVSHLFDLSARRAEGYRKQTKGESMTTRVTVSNHGPDIVVIETVDFVKGEAGSRVTESQDVQPASSADFYVHAHRDLRISEKAR
jgi:hypothetical protein